MAVAVGFAADSWAYVEEAVPVCLHRVLEEQGPGKEWWRWGVRRVVVWLAEGGLGSFADGFGRRWLALPES